VNRYDEDDPSISRHTQNAPGVVVLVVSIAIAAMLFGTGLVVGFFLGKVSQ
jgi:hypothetical protein